MRIVQKVSLIIAILISADITASSIGIGYNCYEAAPNLNDPIIVKKSELLFSNNTNSEIFNQSRVIFPVEQG